MPIPGTATLRVLMVDDDADLLRTMSLYLESMDNVSVSTVPSPIMALRKLMSEHYDVCVSDFNMPGMNGISFLDAIRRDGNPIPFLMVTGSGTDRLESQAFAAGVERVIRKNREGDLFFRELVDAVRTAAEGSGQTSTGIPACSKTCIRSPISP
ncbi:response regulator [Methanofollis fontis]|uniref:Response regulatory domain-containing protein n=1 Tax=Methanofollis fontis TaxID=2052832 RepID=A0A483CPL0_9EURY|nr:response regulator [Methanofollis fontis]TAJ44972.1 hypothetical protein CUJ86_06750 [Methanofollis fontis]